LHQFAWDRLQKVRESLENPLDRIKDLPMTVYLGCIKTAHLDNVAGYLHLEAFQSHNPTF
jgi:hypothetical protein